MPFVKPKSIPGDSEDNPLEIWAIPGLMTLMDVALLRAVEGELTATLTTGHTLLLAWLELKQQAVQVIQLVKAERQEQQQQLQEDDQTIGTTVTSRRGDKIEGFARACLEAASDLIERLSTEKLAQTANLSDPFLSTSSSGLSGSGSQPIVTSSVGSAGVGEYQSSSALEGSSEDTGRRIPIRQRPRDCWESPRLHCPDYCWADDVAQCCQRLLRHLYRHSFVTDVVAAATTDSVVNNSVIQMATTAAGTSSSTSLGRHQSLSSKVDRAANVLILLIQTDIPTRLVQFRTAMEADSVVSKRLYLVKCEYRAPFRAFLEAHQSVLRAPSLTLLDDYMAAPRSNKSSSKQKESAKDQLQSLVENPKLIEALALEQKCEEYEQSMALALLPFCELARFLEHKRARLKIVHSVLEDDGLLFDLQETLRRLKGLLCRKTGPDTSGGIRPLLLDLQGVPRDEDIVGSKTMAGASRALIDDEDAVTRHLEGFIEELKILGRLCETRNAFNLETRKGDVDLPSSILRGCTQFDAELFGCQFEDWYAMAKRQHELTTETNFEDLAEKLRRAEMQMSLAVAPHASLQVVRERVETITSDRSKRFEVLKEMIEEVCLREMNLHVCLNSPDSSQPLSLQPTSAKGVFGVPLLVAGETLPIG